MQSRVLRRRILQVCALVVVGLFVASYTQWEHGLWVAISIAAIVGPFSTALTMQKAANRMYGTIAGLLLSAVLQFYLRYDYHSIFILGVVMAYAIGFAAQQDYRFFIMFVTATVCLNFGYMNMAFTPFEPISFLVSRLIAVVAGIAIFVVVQRAVFGRRSAEAEIQEALVGVAGEVRHALNQVDVVGVTPASVLDAATTLSQRTASFDGLCVAMPYVMARPSRAVVAAHNMRRLKDRCLSELVAYAGGLASQSDISSALRGRCDLALALASRGQASCK